MIEKMKKYTFLVYHKEYISFLEEIRELGVVHVIEKDKGSVEEGSELAQRMDIAKRMGTAVKFLSARQKINDKREKISKKETETEKDVRLANTCDCPDGMKRLVHFEGLRQSLEKKSAAMQLLNKEVDKMEVWGDYDMKSVRKLKEAGYHLTFYSCSERNYREEWSVNYNAITINQKDSQVYFVTVTKEMLHDEISADKLRLPEHSYSELLKETHVLSHEIDRIQNSIDHAAYNDIDSLKHAVTELHNSITFETVKLHSEARAEDKVLLLEGWVPVVKETGLVQLLDKKGIYYQSQIPTEDDKVPILLRNNKFTKLFEVIGNLYALPSYHAIDMTPYFAPFYMMFFGICLGDLGYGILMTLGSLIMLPRSKESLKPVLRLITWLGIGTIIFGGLSGTFFGIPLAEQSWPLLENVKKYMLDSNQLFNFALILGAIQISFAMVIKGVVQVRYKGFMYSLDTWGWLLCIWGNGAIYGLSMLGKLTPEIASPAYIGVNSIAILLMLFFNNPKANILINFGGGLWGLYNKVTGLMGDLLSYIRLFALGISGSVMGLVFNKLAVNMSGDIPILSTIIMILILLLGHSMNIFMSGLGAFVHPMRLTFVEFYNNSGFEGGGKEYKPFKKERTNKNEQETN